MKRIFTLLLIALSAFTLKSSAQNTCTAGFDFAITGLSVQFTPAITTVSTANHNYWRFGDGAISSDVSPAHLFATGGTYHVTHIFYRSENGVATCVDSVAKDVVLGTASGCNLHASFTFKRDSIQTNKVYFTNNSTPPNDITETKWSFGDGTYSTSFNTYHIYANSGLYTACLTIKKNSTCQRDTCIQFQVQTPPPPTVCNLVANFTSYADSLQINKIHFINLSAHFEAGDTIRWNFGDGSPYSYDASPTHVYANAGTYNVCIRIKKRNNGTVGDCVKELCKTVVVQTQCNLQAYFSYHADSLNHNKIYFTNQSVPATAVLHVLWTFGDGTSSDNSNPEHIYAQPGTYNVCIKVYGGGSNCTKEFCKTIEVIGIPCADISKFNFNKVNDNCLSYKFEPVNKNTSWQYHWAFGDGATSNDIMPTHNYSHTGTFHVCLTVVRGTGCTSTTCKEVVTGTCFSCNSVWARYEYFRESTMPNRIYFHALSNYAILSQAWTITRLSNSTIAPVVINQNNPIYTFNDTGNYRVCLRAVTYGQCIKEYCEVIHIGMVEGVCTLNAYPNPTHGAVTVNVQLQAPEMIHVYIYNAMNVLVKQNDKQGSTGNNVVTTNVESLIPGLYTMRIVYGNHICYSRFQKY